MSDADCTCINAEMVAIIRKIADEHGAAGVPFLDDAVKVAIDRARASGGVRERVEALRRLMIAADRAWNTRAPAPQDDQGGGR
jgi:hypothetical protein